MADEIDLAQLADSEEAARDAANALALDTEDPMDVIREIDAQNLQSELNTLADSLDLDDPDYEDVIPKTPQTAPPVDTQGRRPGIDQVLKDVTDNLSPEHAEVIRNMQAMGTRRAQETADLQNELKGVLLDVRELQQQAMQGPVDQTPQERELSIIEQLKPEQLAILDAYAQERGLVSRHELSMEEQARESANALKGSIESGITEHGERFGSIDESGQFQYGEDVKNTVQDVWSRVGDDETGSPLGEGFTAEDLYKIADYDRLRSISNSPAPAPEHGADRQAGRRAMARKAAGSVVRNSGSAHGNASIYDKTTDSFESVIQKAAALAAREIFPTR